MTECISPMRLQAFCDAELAVEQQGAISRHVEGCGNCATELNWMRRFSSFLRGPMVDDDSDITDDELSRLHGRLDLFLVRSDSRQNAFPTVKALMALAASVLIISAAWISELPRASVVVVPAPISVAGVPPWERIAVTLQAEPPVPGAGQSDLADEDVADWLLQNLQSSDPMEQRPS